MSQKQNNINVAISPDEMDVLLKYRSKQITLENISSNDALADYCKERGINTKEIVSVKHWQNMSGEPRFSIVTKGQSITSDVLFKQVHSFISEHAPHIPDKKRYRKGNHLLVINPADIHIGKYASAKETHDSDYDSQIAVTQVLEGVKGLIRKAKGFNIDKVLFCIGNDVLHIDNVYTQTTRGTHQDTDNNKWWEHYEIAIKMYVKCVEMLLDIADVDVIHSMSNHDYQSGYHLAMTLKAWFRNCSQVNIDAGVSHRKYYKYGQNLIGLEHGDGVSKIDNLPMLMAQERASDWSSTRYRYWYLHHLHHKIKHKWRDAKDYVGVTIEYLRSPSAADSWHSRKGFTGVNKAVEAFVHEFNKGQVARLTHYF